MKTLCLDIFHSIERYRVISLKCSQLFEIMNQAIIASYGAYL